MTIATLVLPDIAAEKLGKPKPLIVGVKDVMVKRTWHGYDVLTTQSTFVRLFDTRGIHASRIVRELLNFEGDCLDDETYSRLLVRQLKATHDTDINWKCKWQCIEFGFAVSRTLEYSDAFYMTVEIPYVSICPCSKELCSATGQGIPHQQRAVMKVTTECLFEHDPLPQLIELFLMPKAVMTREDELQWCIKASEDRSYVFAEDAARKIGEALESLGFEEYLVEVEHFETIHQHNMVAVNRKGRFV